MQGKNGEKKKKEKMRLNLWKINRCIARQWYLYDDDKSDECTTWRQSKTYTQRQRRMTETCYFNLNDGEWIFNQTNILFIYHLIRSNHFWALDKFHRFQFGISFNSLAFLSLRRHRHHFTFNFGLAQNDSINSTDWKQKPQNRNEFVHWK